MLNNPYREYHIIHLVNAQFVVITQTITVKEQGAHNALHEVIGKGHLPHIGKGPHQPGRYFAAIHQHKQGCMAAGDEQPAQIVQHPVWYPVCINIFGEICFRLLISERNIPNSSTNNIAYQ